MIVVSIWVIIALIVVLAVTGFSLAWLFGAIANLLNSMGWFKWIILIIALYMIIYYVPPIRMLLSQIPIIRKLIK